MYRLQLYITKCPQLDNGKPFSVFLCYRMIAKHELEISVLYIFKILCHIKNKRNVYFNKIKV